MTDSTGATDPNGTTRATYDAIAPEYARRWGPVPEWLVPELARLAALLPAGARVADVGCGPGHHTRALRDHGFRATGFDLSQRMLGAAGVPGLVRADMRALPIAAGALDAVWCFAALLHIPRSEVPQVLREFARVLRPGGHLILAVAEGDDEGWEEVPYAPGLRRWYIMHRWETLSGMLEAAGFTVTGHERRASHRDWLCLRAESRSG